MSVSKAITIAQKGLTFDIIRRSGLFPPIEILNLFFQFGLDDADSEISIQWEPFSLDAAEYAEFFEHCETSIGKLKIDGLGCVDYSDWFSTVAVR